MTRDHLLASALEQLTAHRNNMIVVVGSVILDEYIIGTADRVSREAPVPIVVAQQTSWVCGGAANVAVGIKKIGWNVALIGCIGKNDAAGTILTNLLNKHEIEIDHMIATPHRPTIKKCRICVRGQQVLRLDHEEKTMLHADDFQAIMKNLHSVIDKATAIVISDYGDGLITPALMSAIRTLARAHQLPVIVDPRGPDFEKYQGVDIIKPNHQEFWQMADRLHLDITQPLEVIARAIIEKLTLKALVITQGEQGMSAILPQEHHFSPARIQPICDITGAGDTALVFLAAGYAAGFAMPSIVHLANAAASIAIQHPGNYAVSLDDIGNAYAKTSSHKTILDWALLAQIIKNLRTQHKRIIFTNGCFDLIHPGHVHVLEHARALGDILVVALNSDASIKRLKGASRPIQPLADRLRVMAAFWFVDFVTAFDQDTPRELISCLRPDVLVKGGDYIAQELPGYDEISAYGGTITTIDLCPGKSTTNLIKQTLRP